RRTDKCQPCTSTFTEESVPWKAIILLVLLLKICIVMLAIPPDAFSDSYLREMVQVENLTGDFTLFFINGAKLSVYDLLWHVLQSFLAGLGICYIGVTVTYFDSLKPGICPPSPLSPRKYRALSGHTFHSSYIMAILNGAMTFFYLLWEQRSQYF
ncbi:unnamed protein product, partial [Owenia fusiformis]